jgi:type IV pilus assembly protein PilY1
LTAVNWSDPVSLANYCAPMNVMMFNPAVSSYDDATTDQMDKFSDLVVGSPVAPFNVGMDALTKVIGDNEGVTGNNFFIGNSGAAAGADTCVPKAVTDLSQINGICPESPGLNGSYRMAGAAWYAHMNRIRPTFAGGSTGTAPPTADTRSLKVTTYGVQLATNTPKMVIPTPLATLAATQACINDPACTSKVTIQPTYRLDKGSGRFGGGTLVDFKVVAQNLQAGTGTFYINYEDSGFGGDYDQDVWGRLSYCIKTSTTTCPLVNGAASIPNGTITITQDIIAQSTGGAQGWGFIISGTNQDGMHFFSGILGLNYNSTTGVPSGNGSANSGLGSVPLDSTGVLGCSNCQVADPAKSWIFTLSSTSNAGILKDPLYYASKWGGFTDLNGNQLPDQVSEFDIVKSDGTSGADGLPDNYYFVTNPLALEASLDRAFIAILTSSSASSVATNTTKLQAGATIYQAKFNSNDWSGQLLALSIDTAGNVNQTTPVWDAATLLPAPDGRAPVTSTRMDVHVAAGFKGGQRVRCCLLFLSRTPRHPGAA